MGGIVSSPFSSSSSSLLLPVDPRPRVNFSKLHFLDIVLIRSAVQLNGFNLDSRIAQHIRHSTTGAFVPAHQRFHKYDRVGLIQLPSFSDSSEFDIDNVEVIEATHFGVQSTPLRRVLDSAMEVSIRPLLVLSHEEEKERQRESQLVEQRKHQQQQEALLTQRLGDAAGALVKEEPIDTPMMDKEQEIRLDFTQKYYRFSGPIINRSYQQCMDRLSDMFHYMAKQLALKELSQHEEDAMRLCVDAFDRDQRGEIEFEDLLQIFRAIDANPQVRNTFTDAEIFELTNQFSDNAGKVFSNSGRIGVEIFLSHWRNSIHRSLGVAKNHSELLSGAFVSMALQTIGVLPVDLSAGHAEYYLPMDFAGCWVNKHGKAGAASGGLGAGGAAGTGYEYYEGKAVEKFINARLGMEYVVTK